MKKTWELVTEKKESVDRIVEDLGVSRMLANILANRGITEKEKIKVFLNPTRDDFYDPYLLEDMEKGVDRILEAIKKKEKTIIYGDYDADGITSITVLKSFLKEQGFEAGYHIPNRLEEGYGLNKETIEEIKEENYTLMITVDCGISGIEEVAYANSLGIDTIITDHHETSEELPDAVAVINPKRKDNKYPFRGLAGVGVVFKLIQALSIKLKLEEKEYLKYLDLVCIGTISDIVPLIDENRVISKLGLRLMEQTKNIGLREMIRASGFQKIDSTTISFGIAPRINACGRMGFQGDALKLFLTETEEEAKEITKKLNEYNIRRQETEKRILEQAILKVEKDPTQEQKNCIVLGDENWHHGVIGIVSSKITEMYRRPSVLLCFEEESAKGSGRSVNGFDLYAALSHCSEYLEKYGGHEMAIGLSLKKKNYKKFKEAFENYAERVNVKELSYSVEIDQEITYQDFNLSLIKEIEKLEPFGEANKMPVFLYKNLKIDSIRTLTEGRHLKLTLKDESRIIHAIGFNLGQEGENYLIGDKVDVIGQLEENTYNGYTKIQMNILDIRKSYS